MTHKTLSRQRRDKNGQAISDARFQEMLAIELAKQKAIFRPTKMAISVRRALQMR